jgi:hypothetical protein
LTNWTKESALAYIAAHTVICDNGCHEWQGSRTKDGYGQLSIDSLIRAFGIKGVHRLMAHLAHGHVFTSRNQQVMHSCHNRACNNPDHISVGTPAQNMADMRLRNPDLCKGENHPRAKLTTEMVREIKRMMAFGWTNQYIHQNVPGLENVKKNVVSMIRCNRRWAHVTI